MGHGRWNSIDEIKSFSFSIVFNQTVDLRSYSLELIKISCSIRNVNELFQSSNYTFYH